MNRYRDIFIKYAIELPTYDIGYYSNCLFGRKRIHIIESIKLDYSEVDKIDVIWGEENLIDMFYILESELIEGADKIIYNNSEYTLINFKQFLEDVLRYKIYNCKVYGSEDFLWDSSYWLRFKYIDENSLENAKLLESGRGLFK